jgi:acetylglutamate kinase
VIAVIKLGGRVQSDPALIDTIKKRWAEKPASVCIVHGGGDEVSGLQRQLGREPVFVNGRRITAAEDLELIRMVLSGSANKRLVSSLCGARVSAVGISGEDANMLLARAFDGEQFGRAGKPVQVNTGIISTLLDAGFLPVISPVGIDADRPGEAMNVNGDDAAAAIAGALGAELLMIADVPGVLDANRAVIHELDQQRTDALVADGTVNSGMFAKLEAGFAALAGGASGVRIAALTGINDVSSGTSLSLTPSMT